MIIFEARVIHTLASIKEYFNFIAFRLFANLAGGLGLPIEIHPKFTSWLRWVLTIEMYPAIVFLVYDWVWPGIALWMQLHSVIVYPDSFIVVVNYPF